MLNSYGKTMTLRERISEDKKQRKGLRNDEKSQDSSDASYETSKRMRKLDPLPRRDGRGSKYDAQGIHKESQKDLCDCLLVDCPGCFMPCPKCSSKKCGHECRRNRRWIYESIEVEGTNVVIKNPYKR